MNQHFRKTKTITLGFALTALFGVSSALAQDEAQPAATDLEPDILRFEADLDLSEDRGQMRFRVFRRDQEPRHVWHVEAATTDRSDDAICRATLPMEAGRDYNRFAIDHIENDDGSQVVLIESTARDGQGPLDPTAHQIAFYLVPRSGATRWSCSAIGRGEYNTLDGGPRLRIQALAGQKTLTREQTTEDVTFCGLREDEQASLEEFDIELGRFLRGAALEVATDDSIALTAQVPETALAAPMTYRFYSWMSATSDFRGAPAGVTVPRPLVLGDGDLTSPWIEGLDELGRHEYVTAGINTAVPMRGVRVFPGHGESRQYFEGFGRPTRLLLALGDGLRYEVALPDMSFEELRESRGIYVEFPEPLISRCLSVMILDAEAGALADADDPEQRRMGKAVAISEISAYATVDGASETSTARQIISELGREPSARRRDQIATLGDLIPAAMVDATAEVLRDEEAPLRDRVVGLLGRMPGDKALPVLRDHLLQVSASDSDYRRTKRAIVAHGPSAAPVLLDLMDTFRSDETERKYVDMIRLLGRVGSELHLMRLIDDVGQGSDATRRERIRAIANGGIGVAPRLISTAQRRGDDDAGLDALTSLVFLGQRHFHHAQADVDDVDAIYDTYQASQSRSHRIRALEALGYFRHPQGATILGDTVLASDPDPIVRSRAATAQRHYDDESARQALIDALDDPSPDVRLAAVRTLNDRDDGTQAWAALIDYVARERWPRGLHHGVQLLARSGEPRALDALAQLVARDLRGATAAAALRALRRAERALPTETIASYLDSERTPPRVREQLVLMLGFSDPEESRPIEILVAVANRDYPAFSDLDARQRESLSTRAMMALGRTQTDRARQFLLATVGDEDRSMTDRANALRGLAFFKDEQLLQQLRDMAPSIPRQLRGRYRDTLNMMRSRLAIEDTQQDLQLLIEGMEPAVEQERQESSAPAESSQPSDTSRP